MFKSIKFKIAIMFVLLTMFIIILIGTFMANSTDTYYHNEFKSLMAAVFNDDYIKQLSQNIDSENEAQKIYNSIYTYSGQLGLDSFRNYYILDGATGKPQNKCSSNETLAKSLDISHNIISAMNGKLGNSINTSSPYMDYAIPVIKNGKVKQIIYIRDTKEETNNVVNNILSIMLKSLLLGLFVSLLFAILLSKTILAPIQTLTAKSKKIASGDFESKIEISGSDEIGMLTQTFNTMAGELKVTLDAIKSEKEKVETILLYMADGVIAFDTLGEIIHINPAAKEYLDLPYGVQVNFIDIFKDCDITLGQISCLGQRENIQRQMSVNGKQLSVYFAPFKSDKKLSGMIAIIQDITEQQRLENSRREFVANVSHELRTPLTTVKSYTETLLDLMSDSEFDTEIVNTFLNTINSETDRMTRLVKDLLLLSRLDYGISDFNKEYFSIADLVKETISRLNIQSKEKQQIISYEPTNQLPLFYGNIDRIEQVITNIISNAIKYTPNGGAITVSTMYVFDSIVIKVKDTGIGISEENLQHIFERFYRVDKARSREMGGTGLGLAIAKEIIEAHNGTISIKSVLNYGTDVLIKLPVNENDNIVDEKDDMLD